MDPVEQALLQALQAMPEDWSVRLLLAEKLCRREADDEASKLIAQAPEPPQYDTDLEQAATFGGEGAIGVCEAYIAKDATSGLAHWLLANLLESKGETERALKHFTVAGALGSFAMPESPATEPEPPLEFIEPGPKAEPAHDELPQPRSRGNRSMTSATAGPVKKATGAPEVFLDPDLAARAAGAPAPPRPPAADFTAPIGVSETDSRGSKSKSPLGKTATAVIVAIGVHVLIALLAAFVVIFQGGRDEPEIVAAVIGAPSKKVEMQKKNVVKQTKKTSSAAAAAAPIAQLMRSNAVAKFSLPDVTKTSTGPLGMGEANFGSGGFGTSGLGMGDGETMFGSSSGGGLEGVFYDLKQTRGRKPSGFNPDNAGEYYGILKRYAAAKFRPDLVSGYFAAEQKMAFTNLIIPDMNAEVGPQAFNVEKQVQPRGWFVHYSGRVVSPENGEWRFVGRFDDAAMVFVNDQLVFDGSWQIDPGAGVSNPLGTTACANGQPAVAGKWVGLSGAFKLDIFVGERPGGILGGVIMIERKGAKYQQRQDGTPILPLFSTIPITASVRERIAKFPYGVATESPVFRVLPR